MVWGEREKVERASLEDHDLVKVVFVVEFFLFFLVSRKELLVGTLRYNLLQGWMLVNFCLSRWP